MERAPSSSGTDGPAARRALSSGESVAVLGAGPAGLSAAYELARLGFEPVVLERDGQVGGLARTETYRGYRFDIGGHRFFTKMDRIAGLWEELLGEDFLTVSRLSRIYYRGRFFRYPLALSNTLLNLGALESLLILLSYLHSQVRPYPREETFEQWVSNRFGRRLYGTFFKTYTEKVWGIPCDRIMADWAAQRIRGLSLAAALSNALLGNRKARTLIEKFRYPRLGPGMMWERFRERTEENGGKVRLKAEVTRLRHQNGRIQSVCWAEENGEHELPLAQVISSLPLDALIPMLDPPPPTPVLQAAGNLSYRAFVLVGLIVDQEALFADQWIYVHSPEVKAGRIQNFKNWSAGLVPDPATSSVGMEYFCNEGDELWSLPDNDLLDLARTELSRLGLAGRDDIGTGFVVRQPKAYPIYSHGYDSNLRVIREYLGGIGNLQTIGRNGMHRYNNMDHSMLTGVLAAENALGARHDLWQVNVEDEYHEEERPRGMRSALARALLARTFARMDKVAFAMSVGVLSALVFSLATAWLVIKGGVVIGPHLRLLAQYFPGYTVSLKGAFVAGLHGFGWGFLLGWLFAYLRNLIVAAQIYRVKRKTQRLALRDFFDYL